LLSGVPVGIALACVSPLGRVVCFTVFLLIETAHTLSPIVLAWTHAGFRRVMLNEPRKYIGLPSAVFAVGTLVSIATAIGWASYVPGPGQYYHATGWDNPFPILIGVYFAWNFYHFSMQNYGVLRLCGADLGRWGKPLAFVGTAAAIKLMPIAVSVNHWITDIGLSWRASKRWVFVALLLLLAPVAFSWSTIPTPEGIPLRKMEGAVIALYGIRLFGLGFVHFLYSRWLWKFSDRRVRATIGASLHLERRNEVWSFDQTHRAGDLRGGGRLDLEAEARTARELQAFIGDKSDRAAGRPSQLPIESGE
jgi:hypothetical protein